MSTPAFPVETLGAPLSSSYSINPSDTRVRTTTRDGVPFSYLSSTAPLTKIAVKWSWSLAQYAIFKSWYRNDIKDGTISFTIDDIYLDGELGEITARFTEPPKEDYQDWGNYDVSATLETATHDYTPLATLTSALPTEPFTDKYTWPKDLFGSPTDWSVQPADSSQRGNTDGYALSDINRKSHCSVMAYSAKWEMSQDNKKLFSAWYHYKLVDGADWFWLYMEYNGVWGYKKVRFTKPVVFKYEEVDWWEITGNLETVEYNYLPIADCETLLPPGGVPSFSVQPTDQIGDDGDTILFTATATGDYPRTYKWYANDVEISGETAIQLSTQLTSANYTTAYKLDVTNALGSITSNTVYGRLTPTFTTQPQWNAVITGGTATATVVVAGSGTINLQWYKDEELLSGKTSSTLTISNAQPSDGGDYYCIATSEYGTGQSNSSYLYVNFYFTVAENSSIGLSPYFLESTSGVAASLETELANVGLEPYFVEDETGMIMSSDTEPISISIEPYFIETTSA